MTDATTPPPEDLAAEAVQSAHPASIEAELATLRAVVSQARKEADEATLRAQAEVQNLRRRLERDADNARKFVLEKFAGDLLVVVDSLDRGLASLDAGNDALKPAREGLELTLKQMKDVLRKFDVEEIDPRGQPFNPQLHEAVAQIPNAEVAPNTVIEVAQKGFQLSGRLLRPAIVVVSRAP